MEPPVFKRKKAHKRGCLHPRKGGITSSRTLEVTRDWANAVKFVLFSCALLGHH